MNRSMELQAKWGDQFVSIEHLVAAMAEDGRFGESLFKAEGLTKDKLDAVRRRRGRGGRDGGGGGRRLGAGGGW